ncbi:MAG: L-2-hydroxyglutarate oxidase [Planctomycetota bacterium]
MSVPDTCDVAVVGGGIVGLATARAVTRVSPRSVLVLEAEAEIASHQTGHNSGVIHSGLYYKPGSLKARYCTEGREALFRFCGEFGIPHERCGKVVVATNPAELPVLEEVERRGKANGLAGLERLTPRELARIEPHASGIAALRVPETGIVDYKRVAAEYARQIVAAGGEVHTGCRVLEVRRENDAVILATTQGTLRTCVLVNCAGLQSDRLARLSGIDPGVQIIPFRGEYYRLVPERAHLVRHLIYPVPDPRFPFLGVHFTRTIGGEVEAGPNAVLSLKREGYSRTSFSLGDTLETLSFPGFWHLAATYWRTGLGELYRSWSKDAFVAALRRLMPELTPTDVVPHMAGVRAQAVDRHGRLVDDFHVQVSERMVHVLNAPSPAATSSLAIGDAVAALVREQMR